MKHNKGNNTLEIPFSPIIAIGTDFMCSQEQKLDEIARIMSHDVRQPLACIMGLITALKEGRFSYGKEWLAMLEKEANDLDCKIKTIVSIAD